MGNSESTTNESTSQTPQPGFLQLAKDKIKGATNAVSSSVASTEQPQPMQPTPTVGGKRRHKKTKQHKMKKNKKSKKH